MAAPVKVLAAKPDYVSLIPGAQAVEGESHLLCVVPWPPRRHRSTCWHVHAETQNRIENLFETHC